MTAPDLAAIRARLEAATRGPWRWAYPGSDSPELVGMAGDENYSYETEVVLAEHSGECGCRSACSLTVTMNDADAEFIAAARTDVEVLLAEVERLRAIVDALGPVAEPCPLCRGRGYVVESWSGGSGLSTWASQTSWPCPNGCPGPTVTNEPSS